MPWFPANMQELFNWDDVRFFLTVHRQGNLARAGATLKLDPTTVGRRITSLEERLGARLFDKTPHGYQLTSAGRRLLPRAQRIEDEALAVERDVAGEDQRLQGVVRMSATEMLTTRFIAPWLPRFAEQYPDIHLHLVCTPGKVDLSRREVDIALSLSRPRRDDIVVKKLFEIELRLYASKEYLERHGEPDQSLAGHRLIAFAETRAFARENDWLRQNVGDAEVVMRSDSVSAIFAAAVGGLGIALLPCQAAEPDPALVRLAKTGAPAPRFVWQAVHPDLQHAARIRAVIEFLSGLLVDRALT